MHISAPPAPTPADAAASEAAAAAKVKARKALSRLLSLLRSGDPGIKWYCAALSAALAARSYASMKMYRQIGVLGALLARRSWGDLQAAQVWWRRSCMQSLHPHVDALGASPQVASGQRETGVFLGVFCTCE